MNYWTIKDYPELPIKVMDLFKVLGIEIWRVIFKDKEDITYYGLNDQIQCGNYPLQHFFICEDTIFNIIMNQNFIFTIG